MYKHVWICMYVQNRVDLYICTKSCGFVHMHQRFEESAHMNLQRCFKKKTAGFSKKFVPSKK